LHIWVLTYFEFGVILKIKQIQQQLERLQRLSVVVILFVKDLKLKSKDQEDNIDDLMQLLLCVFEHLFEFELFLRASQVVQFIHFLLHRKDLRSLRLFQLISLQFALNFIFLHCFVPFQLLLRVGNLVLYLEFFHYLSMI